MPRLTATIGAAVGLHARPATLFVQAVTASGMEVTIAKNGGEPVDARSLLSVIALGAHNGDTVTLAAEGEGAEATLAELARLLESDLDAA